MNEEDKFLFAALFLTGMMTGFVIGLIMADHIHAAINARTVAHQTLPQVK